MTTKQPPDVTVRDEADLFALWQQFMGPGGFGRRSLWLIFLDRGGHVHPLIVPIDDIADEPDPVFTRNIALVVDGLINGGEVASVAMLISRPGPVDMTAADRRWARALHGELGTRLGRWPIHLATIDSIRVFAPDDLLGAA
jgi:hypothetical protein